MYKWKIITKLSEKDIWRDITYVCFGWCETWIIKSFDNEKQIAYVVYKYNNDRKNYQNYTAQATNYIDFRILIF